MSDRATIRTLFLSLLAISQIVRGVAAEDAARPLKISERATNDMLGKAHRCALHKDDSGWWFMSPEGKRFFSLGICMFNQGLAKEDYNPAKPSYAAFRHYDVPEAWADSSLRRVKSWGFTTVGGWSDYATLAQSGEHDLWITPVLHLGSTSGAPWFDMWEEKVLYRIEEVAERNMISSRGDPRVLGYFSDNELGWWNAIMWKMTLAQPATSGQRQRLIKLVRETYGDDWNRLTEDFEPEGAANWEELADKGMLWLRPGSKGIHTMRRFLGMVAERYYQVMRDTIRKVDPHALYLGDRYQSFYYPEVPTASRPYVDVVSTNLNASWSDGTFLRSYLETLHSLTGKPVLVSEFYLAAEENRSGNKNTVGEFPEVPTQKERAAALSNTLRGLATLSYVVGADWFQYYDEPPHGRKLDGEDYNFGLVDIHDEPYDEVVEAFSSIDASQLKSASLAPRANATRGVPRAPADPFADFQPMSALKNWDRERGFVPPSAPSPTGDMYVCWNADAIYLATFVLDIVEPDYYRDGVIPEGDRAVWRVRLNDGTPMTAVVGAGLEPKVSETSVQAKSVSGTYHDVRCITVLKLPASLFGRKRLEAGDSFVLDSSFTTHGRAYRLGWDGEYVLCE